MATPINASGIPAFLQPGSSTAYNTGSWRPGIAPVVTDDCNSCGLCVTVCPEGAIYADLDTQKLTGASLRRLEHALPGGSSSFNAKQDPTQKKHPASIDYDYCKGCGICEYVCPTKNIKMEPEGEIADRIATAETPIKAGFGESLAKGHTSCAGCGNALTMRYILEAISYSDRKPIAVSPTGCTEIFSSMFPYSAWNIPWVHSLFENSAALASGIELGSRIKGTDGIEKVIVFAGDGGTADIGLQSLSGMIERGGNILYVMIDNEAYMNTGIQRSSSTPLGAGTTTSVGGTHVLGKQEAKKPLVDIIGAHGNVWAATASIADPYTLMAVAYHLFNNADGPAFLQVHAPCPRGWRFESRETIKVAKMALDTGLWPQYVIQPGGKVVLTRNIDPGKLKAVTEYLKMQGRFGHLFTQEGGEEVIRRITEERDEGIARLIQRSRMGND